MSAEKEATHEWPIPAGAEALAGHARGVRCAPRHLGRLRTRQLENRHCKANELLTENKLGYWHCTPKGTAVLSLEVWRKLSRVAVLRGIGRHVCTGLQHFEVGFYKIHEPPA